MAFFRQETNRAAHLDVWSGYEGPVVDALILVLIVYCGTTICGLKLPQLWLMLLNKGILNVSTEFGDFQYSCRSTTSQNYMYCLISNTPSIRVYKAGTGLRSSI